MDQHPLLPELAADAPSTTQLIESLLFVACEPVSIGQLARALDVVPDAVEAALDELAAACASRGIRVQRSADRVQFVSAPEAAAVVARFLGVQASTRLSAAALEVLGIVAYRQPITRAQIEAVRGVDCGGVLRALLARELVCETGRLEAVGRPILYGTTAEFLHQFGLTSLAALPPLETPDDRRWTMDDGKRTRSNVDKRNSHRIYQTLFYFLVSVLRYYSAAHKRRRHGMLGLRQGSAKREKFSTISTRFPHFGLCHLTKT